MGRATLAPVSDALRVFVEPTLSDAVLVASFEGWNDAGESASGAVAYLERAIGAAPLAEIDGEDFLDLTVCRPSMRLDDDGQRIIQWPATRFSYGSRGAAGEMVFAHGIEPHLQWRRYCDLFTGMVRRAGVRRVVLLGAYVADVVYSRPVSVTGFASEKSVLEEIGVSESGYEGPTGIVSVLANELLSEGLEVVSLWAGLPHYISACPNPRGSLALVDKLMACLGLEVDLDSLQSDALAFEDRISALVASDPELEEYVKQLKRREFAQ